MSGPSAAAGAAQAPIVESPPERLTYRTMFAYGSIQFSTHAIFTINGVHLLFFYTDTAKLNAAAAGLVLALGHLLDAVTNPVMGMISDGVRWRGGRRRPFFIPGCTVTAVVWVLLYSPAPTLTGRPLFWYMLVLYLAYNTARTAFYIPWTALMPDLTEHYDERSRLAAYRIFLGVPGDVIGGILPLVLAGVFASQRQGFFVATVVIACVLIATGVVAYRGTYERPPPPRAPRAPVGWRARGRQVMGDTREALASVWTLPTAVVFTASLLATIGTIVPISTFRYITKYYFHDPGLDQWVMGLYFVGALVAVPGWLWLARHWDKKRAYLAGLLGYLIAAAPIPACGPDDAQLFVACMVGIGACGSGLLLIPTSFSPDVIAWNRLYRPGGREGFFYGFWGFLLPCGTALASALVGFTLDRIGFVPDVGQTGATLHGMLAMFILYPAVFLGLAAIVFVWYPITREVYDDVRRRLAECDAGEAAGGGGLH